VQFEQWQSVKISK